MQNARRFTVLSLMERNRTGPTIRRPRPRRWFYRRNGELSDRLLANAVQWPHDTTGALRKSSMHTAL